MISIVIISKDEPALDKTLTVVSTQVATLTVPCEILVVDASDGRLDYIQRKHAQDVRWLEFKRPAGVTVSIPHQRNVGVRAARGEIIVFTDSGCEPAWGWLEQLTAPLFRDELVTAGLTLASADDSNPYDSWARRSIAGGYLNECATINMAFRREVFLEIEGFDESFTYGSDIDFSWRLIDAGYRIKAVPGSVTYHDWGRWRRQLRRSFSYGKARARLYRKHRSRLRLILRNDPMVVIYPAFLFGLPLTIFFPLYPALLLIPAWRNRSNGIVRVLADHLTFGAGVIMELISL